jgi:methionine synthase II (cobalamin-independent)
MAHYNFSNFIIKNFDLSFVNDNGIGMLQTKEFANFDEAYQYMKLLYSDKDMARKLSGMRAIVISASNFELLQKYFSFDDYAEFYNEHFSDIPEPEIEGIMLDEPILIEGVDQAEEEDY